MNTSSPATTTTAPVFQPGITPQTERIKVDSAHEAAVAHYAISPIGTGGHFTLAFGKEDQVAYLHSILGNANEIHSRNTYINLTEMCAPFWKRPGNFLGRRRTKQDIEYYAEILKVRPADLIFKTKGPGGATWGHQKIAVSCAEWLSPCYRIWSMRAQRWTSGQPSAADGAAPGYRPSLIALLKASNSPVAASAPAQLKLEDHHYRLTSSLYGWRGIPCTNFMWIVPAREKTAFDWRSIYPDCPDAHRATRAADEYLTWGEMKRLAVYLKAKGHWDIGLWDTNTLVPDQTRPPILSDSCDSRYFKLETQFDYPFEFPCWGWASSMPSCPSLNVQVPKLQICTVSTTINTRCVLSGEKLTVKPIIAFHVANEPERFVHPKYAQGMDYICPPDMEDLKALYAS